MRKFTLLSALVCWGWTVKAQDSLKTVKLDEVVFIGTKTELPVEKSGKTIFKITREEIEKSPGKTVSDLLNEVPGVQMDGNFGPLGTNIDYFVRGAASRRTLILIDGVPFNDPSGINQTYDLRFLDVDQVESIEVLKGGLSTLYGTGAAAGVISIKLRESAKDSFGGSVDATYGSFNTFTSNVNISGKTRGLSYLLTGGFRDSDGFSAAADENSVGGFDDDAFQSRNLLAKIGYQFSDQFNLDLTASVDDFENDFDAGAFSDGDNSSEYQQVRVGLSPQFSWAGGSIRGNIFYADLNRLFDSPGFTPEVRSIDEFGGNNVQMDFVIDQSLFNHLKFIGGVNYQYLGYSQPQAAFSDPFTDAQSFSLVDPYASLIYDHSNFTVQVGGRLNLHSEYGSNFVWNINPSYLLHLNEATLKVFGSYATSFVTPSLFQLFGPFGSNVALEPEQTQSAEGGLAYLSEWVNLEITYFYRNDDNLILFLANGYENAEEQQETSGLEVSGNVKVTDKINLAAHYTYVNGLGEATLFRIPDHKFGVSLDFEPYKNLNFALTYLHTGSNVQPFFNPETFATDEIDIDSYDLFDFGASYTVSRFTFRGSINNLLDEEYVAIYGFNAIGRNLTIGVNYAIN